MSGTLLIVDDEEDVLGVLIEYLTALGYDVVAATSGADALAALASGRTFDVAIVDWTLPDVPGEDIIQAARTRLPDCRIIVTTGHGAEVVNEAWAGRVGGSIVRKPFTMRTLSSRIAMLLENPK